VARLWDAATGKPLPWCLAHQGFVRSCAFSSDGELLVTGSGKSDHSLRLWETATGKELRRFVIEDLDRLGKHGVHGVLVCHLSADGKHLAAVSTFWDPAQNRNCNQMSVWDARTGELLKRRAFAGGPNERFTPDGEGVTVHGRYSLTIEQTTTGRELVKISGDLGHPVTFSPDGTLVAVGIHETLDKPDRGRFRLKGVRMAEVASGQELFHIEGWIEFVAFSADGRLLATADPKGLRIWDAVSGQQLFQRAWPEGLPSTGALTPIGSLVFLPGGRAMATGMGDGTVLVWDLAADALPVVPKREFRNEEANLGREELDALWSVLAGDARTAQLAIRNMVGAPVQAVALLKERLQPVAEVEQQQVQQLIADLDSERFVTRTTASRELAKMGEQTEPALRKVLTGKPSLEMRERVEQLLTALRTVPSGPVLRALRAIEALERIGTQEARRVLEAMAKGAHDARLTQEAEASLERLAKRPAPAP
jgi:hypothetical protein